MHINDIFEQNNTTLSFEFFPPKTDEQADALFQIIAQLEELKPNFISVTYGAGGSTRDRTHDLVLKINSETSLSAIPHLTCVGHTKQEITNIITRYASEGVANILALAGDPPKDDLNYDRSTDDFQHAVDLVKFIKEFNDKNIHADPRGFGIGVAAFPEGHPGTPNRIIEMDHLKAKVDAGADYICTQMFFDNRDFYDFRDRCDLAGINIPIIAGIMPVTTLKSMTRMADFAAGARFPAGLIKAMKRTGDDTQASNRVGIHWATEQCRDLLDNNVKGIHFYTLNKSQATRDIYRSLGIRNSTTL